MVRNIVLIVIDTLRRDHLGCYGYDKETSPFIDEVSSKGVLFLNDYPSDVPTIPSFTSIFTGQRGVKTGVVSHHIEDILPDNVFWLPQYLSSKGVVTCAVSTLYFMRKWFARGFNYYLNPVAGNRARTQQVDAEEINFYAINWLKKHRDERFFLLIHYWDPHMFYKPPPPYNEMFYQGNPRDPENKSLEKVKQLIDWPFRERQVNNVLPGATDLNYIIAQYDGEIRYDDDNVKKVFETLEDLNLLEDTMIIITSDHGESLGEHDIYFDHADVYEPTAHVPLIFYGSEIPSDKKIESLVQSIDLAPTILDYMGFEIPSEIQGFSLKPLIEGEVDKVRDVAYVNQATWTARRAMIKNGWKFIKTYDSTFWKRPRIELYNLRKDPMETENLAENERDLLDSMELEMTRWLDYQLHGSVDPVRLIVKKGVPALRWVENAYRSKGLLDKWLKWFEQRKHFY